MLKELKAALSAHPDNPFLQGHVAALESLPEDLEDDNDDDGLDTCPTCNGEGTSWDGLVECLDCGGTGH